MYLHVQKFVQFVVAPNNIMSALNKSWMLSINKVILWKESAQNQIHHWRRAREKKNKQIYGKWRTLKVFQNLVSLTEKNARLLKIFAELCKMIENAFDSILCWCIFIFSCFYSCVTILDSQFHFIFSIYVLFIAKRFLHSINLFN